MSKKIRLTYGHFNWVKLVLSSELPFPSKGICMYLATFMNMENEVAWPSRTRMEAELGISRGALNKHLDIIEMAGWISRDRGDSKTNTRYYIKFPESIEVQLLGSSRDELGSSPDELGVVHEVNTNKQLNKQTNKRFVPPSVEEVRNYIKEHSYPVDPEAFVDFYEARGWMLNKTPMKSWQAAVRTWTRNDRSLPAKPALNVTALKNYK